VAVAVRVRDVETRGNPLTAPRGARTPLALQRLLPHLVEALRSTAVPANTRVGEMASYHLGWTDAEGRSLGEGSGKFIRGCMALWAAEQCGGDLADAAAVAAAVEWIHNFTLVHDDIQDGDHERRHRPTVWVVWGSAQAINAGNGMHAVAYRALLSGRGRPAARLRAAAALNTAVVAVIEGQCLDLDLEGRIETPVATYLRMVRGKTGALIGASLEAGALMGGASARQAALLRRAGMELGVAFQIRDDWLGTWGDSALTGKRCGGDIERRKITYPVVVAQSRLHGAARRELRRLYRAGGGGEQVILGLLDQARAEEAVAEELASRGRSAADLAARCGLSAAAMDDFRSILDFVVERAA
jgi:geranylgeranyl diphosphate synthase type I